MQNCSKNLKYKPCPSNINMSSYPRRLESSSTLQPEHQILHFEVVPSILLQFCIFDLHVTWSVLFSHKELLHHTVGATEIRVIESVFFYIYKLVVYLKTLSETQTVQHSRTGWQGIINLEGCWRKQSWPTLRYSSSIFFFFWRNWENPQRPQ